MAVPAADRGEAGDQPPDGEPVGWRAFGGVGRSRQEALGADAAERGACGAADGLSDWGQVLQLDWAEVPTRPKIVGRQRRVYALIASLPLSGAQTAHFRLDLTAASFLDGHVRALEWLGGVPRECV
jgi:hypothetical protein